MNYINNSMEMCCCSLGESNDVFVRPAEVLVDLGTGRALSPAERPTVGRTYKCAEMFALMRGYTTVKIYQTEEKAKTAYVELIENLGTQGRVFEV